MANIEVNRQSAETGRDSSPEQRQEGRVARRGYWDPFTGAYGSGDVYGWDPFGFVRRFYEDVDRAFRPSGESESRWTPAVEVTEQDGQLCVRADLPGLSPEDVKVEVLDDALIVEGERKSENRENKGGIYRTERRYGRFYREIPLPPGTNPDDATAQFQNGVLEVKLRVPEQKTNRRSIRINSGQSGILAGKESR